MKETIRKLPMFETYEDASSSFDFEWPSKKDLQQIKTVKQLRLKEIRYQQDPMGMLSAIKIICHDAQSPFFSAALDRKSTPQILYCTGLYDNKDGHYRCNNLAARIEFNKMISNIYLNQDKSGICRIGTKRGNGLLSHVMLEDGEEIIGVYGTYYENHERAVISGLGFIVWNPSAADV